MIRYDKLLKVFSLIIHYLRENLFNFLSNTMKALLKFFNSYETVQIIKTFVGDTNYQPFFNKRKHFRDIIYVKKPLTFITND